MVQWQCGTWSAMADVKDEVLNRMGAYTLTGTTVVGNADEKAKETNPSVQKLLDVLGNEELSAAQIMERLDLSHRPTFRKNYLNPALALGAIEMTIPDKPRSRNQKYRKKQLGR